MAVDKQDREITPMRRKGSGADNLNQAAVVFDRPLNELKAFHFQSRPYTWVQFENISLRETNHRDKPHVKCLAWKMDPLREYTIYYPTKSGKSMPMIESGPQLIWRPDGTPVAFPDIPRTDRSVLRTFAGSSPEKNRRRFQILLGGFYSGESFSHGLDNAKLYADEDDFSIGTFAMGTHGGDKGEKTLSTRCSFSLDSSIAIPEKVNLRYNFVSGKKITFKSLPPNAPIGTKIMEGVRFMGTEEVFQELKRPPEWHYTNRILYDMDKRVRKKLEIAASVTPTREGKRFLKSRYDGVSVKLDESDERVQRYLKSRSDGEAPTDNNNREDSSRLSSLHQSLPTEMIESINFYYRKKKEIIFRDISILDHPAGEKAEVSGSNLLETDGRSTSKPATNTNAPWHVSDMFSLSDTDSAYRFIENDKALMRAHPHINEIIGDLEANDGSKWELAIERLSKVATTEPYFTKSLSIIAAPSLRRLVILRVIQSSAEKFTPSQLNSIAQHLIDNDDPLTYSALFYSLKIGSDLPGHQEALLKIARSKKPWLWWPAMRPLRAILKAEQQAPLVRERLSLFLEWENRYSNNRPHKALTPPRGCVS